ncbi:Sodium channel [Caligus rogercresseyi]|uniref:Sodium channel n=1 Tax=Caligus rogercresseyi TaxID=217165 RepID=A0A7T8GTU6_CALRO|nr:Sodium channel [Caligus rogercresseyi]
MKKGEAMMLFMMSMKKKTDHHEGSRVHAPESKAVSGSPQEDSKILPRLLKKVGKWLLDIEMGVVWCVVGVSIISFIFAAIWYIDPALLTLVLKFKATECRTVRGDFLIGINNCSWSSCRLGCTTEIYRCWKIIVQPLNASEHPTVGETRLYPNVRGCGYPPELNCEEFFYNYGPLNATYPCWISSKDPSIAITSLNLRRAKREVLLSLVPLFIFIIFVLYAFCRLECFPFAIPPSHISIPDMNPSKLAEYRNSLLEKREEALSKYDALRCSGAVRSFFPYKRAPKTFDVEDPLQTPIPVNSSGGSGSARSIDCCCTPNELTRSEDLRKSISLKSYSKLKLK